MKRLCFVSVLMLLAASGASAQQYRTSYFMEGSTMRGYLNPALRPDRGYVYIPVLGTTSVNFNSNALTFKTIFYPVGDNGQLVSLLDDRVTWHDIEPNLKTMNKVGFDLHMTLLGAGFYTGRDFWTIEAGLDVTGGFYLPKSFVEFVKLGSKANAYDMGGLMAGADAVMNISAGYSRRINDELTVGGRVNFKGGLARANMNYDRLNVTLNGEKWAVDAGGNLALSLNGLDVPTDAEGYVDMDRLDAESFVSNIRGLAGFGLTFDIGAEYVWMERFKFSAAILNLGFMNWSEKHTFVGRSEASYDFVGMRYDFNPETNQWETVGEGGDFNFDEFAKFKEASGRARTKMYPGFVLGAEYDIFGNNLLGAGALFTHRKNEYYTRTEVALSATVRPIEWFTASLSWSVGNYKNIGDNFFNSFGFAFNFHTGWINFFAGTDFLMFKVNPQFIPVGQKVFNITVGLSVPLGPSPYCRYGKC